MGDEISELETEIGCGSNVVESEWWYTGAY